MKPIGLGPKLKKILKSKGVSVAHVSRETDIPYATLFAWLSGSRGLPKPMARLICLKCNISESKFFAESESYSNHFEHPKAS